MRKRSKSRKGEARGNDAGAWATTNPDKSNDRDQSATAAASSMASSSSSSSPPTSHSSFGSNDSSALKSPPLTASFRSSREEEPEPKHRAKHRAKEVSQQLPPKQSTPKPKHAKKHSHDHNNNNNNNNDETSKQNLTSSASSIHQQAPPPPLIQPQQQQQPPLMTATQHGHFHFHHHNRHHNNHHHHHHHNRHHGKKSEPTSSSSPQGQTQSPQTSGISPPPPPGSRHGSPAVGSPSGASPVGWLNKPLGTLESQQQQPQMSQLQFQQQPQEVQSPQQQGHHTLPIIQDGRSSLRKKLSKFFTTSSSNNNNNNTINITNMMAGSSNLSISSRIQATGQDGADNVSENNSNNNRPSVKSTANRDIKEMFWISYEAVGDNRTVTVTYPIPAVFVRYVDPDDPSFEPWFTIIYCLDKDEDIGTAYRTWFKELSKQLRVNILGFDYTGCGRHEGVPSDEASYLDVAACYLCLTQEKGITGDRIVLCARGMGSGPAVHLAYLLSSSRGSFPVANVVWSKITPDPVECPFPNPPPDTKKSKKKNKKNGPFSSISGLGSVGGGNNNSSSNSNGSVSCGSTVQITGAGDALSAAMGTGGSTAACAAAAGGGGGAVSGAAGTTTITTTATTTMCADTVGTREIAGLILLAGVSNAGGSEFDNVKKAPKIVFPVLMVHGIKDTIATINSARKLGALFPKLIDFVEVPDTSHRNIYYHISNYVSKVTQFLAGISRSHYSSPSDSALSKPAVDTPISVIKMWLKNHGLGRYQKNILALNCKKLEDLRFVTREDLEGVGITDSFIQQLFLNFIGQSHCKQHITQHYFCFLFSFFFFCRQEPYCT